MCGFDPIVPDPSELATDSNAFDCNELKRAPWKKRDPMMPTDAVAAAAAAADADVTNDEVADANDEEAFDIRRSSCCATKSDHEIPYIIKNI